MDIVHKSAICRCRLISGNGALAAYNIPNGPTRFSSADHETILVNWPELQLTDTEHLLFKVFSNERGVECN